MNDYYQFHQKIVFRAPLMPYKAAFDIEELKTLFSTPIVKEALYLASPVLYKEMEI